MNISHVLKELPVQIHVNGTDEVDAVLSAITKECPSARWMSGALPLANRHAFSRKITYLLILEDYILQYRTAETPSPDVPRVLEFFEIESECESYLDWDDTPISIDEWLCAG